NASSALAAAGSASRSSSVTRRPRFASTSAAASPVMPQPTTTAWRPISPQRDDPCVSTGFSASPQTGEEPRGEAVPRHEVDAGVAVRVDIHGAAGTVEDLRRTACEARHDDATGRTDSAPRHTQPRAGGEGDRGAAKARRREAATETKQGRRAAVV